MPQDMTMCPGQDCPLKNECYRFRGVVYGRFDAFGSPPYDRQKGSCEQFYDIARLKPTERQIRDKAYYQWLAAGRPEGQADAIWMAAHDELEKAMLAELTPLPVK
jgi:hypothetical protein